MEVESRSQNGCWTCRLRKRKCDEKGPICSECLSLGLDCHGYEKKPTWMDRGVKQKAQATKFKQMAAEMRRKKRVNQVLNHETSVKILGSRSHSRDISFSSTISSTSVTTPTTPNQPLVIQRVYPSSSLSPGFFQSDDSHISFARSDDIIASDLLATSTTSSGFDPFFEEIDFSLSEDYVLEDNLLSSHEYHFPHKGTALPNPGNSLEQVSKSTQTNGECTVTNNLTIEKIEDAILLAYYLEKVFSFQFQFRQFQLPGFNQGHILWLASKSPSLYHTILALSSSYKSLWNGESSAYLANNKYTPRYDLAVKEFRSDLQEPESYEEIWFLACTIMLLYSALLHKSKSVNWQLYLQVGISIVTSWIEKNYESSGPCQINWEPKSEENGIESAKIFLIGSIVRFDVLSSLTRDSAPALSGQYQKVLQASHYGIRLETVFGCRNWVLKTLLDVYLLRDWKRSTKAAGTLSLWELMWKGHRIKKALERDISLNPEEMNKHKQELQGAKIGDSETLYSDYDILVVIHIFACAVAFFLEVVVFGAYLKLPEIKDQVNRALESFAYINDSELLHVLRWPLCVAGSVAGPEQYDFVRSLLSSPNVARTGTFCESLELLELLEECWQMNAELGNNEAGVEITRVRMFMS